MLHMVYWFLRQNIVSVNLQKGDLMKHLFALILISISTSVFAATSPTAPDYSMAGIEVGFKSNTASLNGSSSDKQETGFQLGLSGVFNISEKIGLKSGLFYSERPFSGEVGATNTKGKVTYFEVPALLVFKFEDYAGAYVGPTLAIKMGDEVTPGALSGVKSILVPITFGAQFKFLPNIGANFFFETVPGEIATGIENSRAVGVNLLFTLD